MATLPTITVTDAQAARIMAAYKAKFGTSTQAETIAAYKRWLAEDVRAVVEAHEAQAIDERNNAAKRDALAAVRAELPDPEAVA